VRGVDDEVGNGAELEEHEAATTVMFGGEVTEGDVWEVADEVKVADDGHPWRRRRKLLLVVVAAAAAMTMA